jgi:hypothetical protein
MNKWGSIPFPAFEIRYRDKLYLGVSGLQIPLRFKEQVIRIEENTLQFIISNH